MSNFSNWIMTDQFLDTLTEVQVSTSRIYFRNVYLSQTATDPKAVKSLKQADLSKYKNGMVTPVTKVVRKDASHIMQATFASQNNIEGSFIVRSAVLTASFSQSATAIEYIVAVAVAEDDGMVMPDRTKSVSYTFRPRLTLTDAGDITAFGSAEFVSYQDFEEHKSLVGGILRDLEDRIDNNESVVENTVHLFDNQIVQGAKSFIQPITGTLNGNALSASKLLVSRTITLTGDVTGSTRFDGSNNVSIVTKLATTSATLSVSTVDYTYRVFDNPDGTTGRIGYRYIPEFKRVDVVIRGTFNIKSNYERAITKNHIRFNMTKPLICSDGTVTSLIVDADKGNVTIKSASTVEKYVVINDQVSWYFN